MYPRQKNNKPFVPNPSARRRRRQRCSQVPEDFSKRFTSHYVDLHTIVPKSPPPSFYVDDDDAPQPSTSLYASSASKQYDLPAVGHSFLKPRRNVSPSEKIASSALCSVVIPVKNKKSARLSKPNKSKQSDEKEDLHQSSKLSEASNRKADDYKKQDGEEEYQERSGGKTPETSKSKITSKCYKAPSAYAATRSPCVARAYEELKAQTDPKPFNRLREWHEKEDRKVKRERVVLKGREDEKNSHKGSMPKTLDNNRLNCPIPYEVFGGYKKKSPLVKQEPAKKPANEEPIRHPFHTNRPKYNRQVEEFPDPQDFWARVRFPSFATGPETESSESERHDETTDESSNEMESYGSNETLY